MSQTSGSRIAGVLFPLPLPLPEPLDYRVPEQGFESLTEGSFVMCPLGKREVMGVVWSLRAGAGDNLKPLKVCLDLPALPVASRQFVDRAARYICAPPGQVLKSVMRVQAEEFRPRPISGLKPVSPLPEGLVVTPARAKALAAAHTGVFSAAELARQADVSPAVIKSLVAAGALVRHEHLPDERFATPDPHALGPQLTAEQAHAAMRLKQALSPRRYETIVLDGVTGSGKTEVYLEAIATVLADSPDAQVLVLVPEIALTQQVLSRFEARFGAEPVPWHSGLTQTTRARAWREIISGRARLIVGARSALFLPFADLALIVVDEEHDATYKQDEGMHYQARDLSVLRGSIGRALVVLASATPSLESVVNADQGRYSRVRLASRPGVARLPQVELIDMRHDGPEPGQWLSPLLISAMKDTLAANEQVLLYLNRRGYAPLVLCKACGHKMQSPDTQNWLVEHRYSGRLVCHLTGFSMPKPSACPQCQTPNSLIGVGPGVERVAEEVRRFLPEARTAIFSSDTASTPAAVNALIAQMEASQIDILIGTQIVAKGHNFPNLTLVGVVDADSGLKGADLRAGERTWQLLSQVVGRAGRADKPGRAMLQTYLSEHPAMQALALQDRASFMDLETQGRRDLGFPPFGKLAALILSAPSAEAVDQAAIRIAASAPTTEGVDVYGPAPAPIAVVRGQHRRRFLIRAERSVDLSAYMSAWRSRMKEAPSVRIVLDIEPYSFL